MRCWLFLVLFLVMISHSAHAGLCAWLFDRGWNESRYAQSYERLSEALAQEQSLELPTVLSREEKKALVDVLAKQIPDSLSVVPSESAHRLARREFRPGKLNAQEVRRYFAIRQSLDQRSEPIRLLWFKQAIEQLKKLDELETETIPGQQRQMIDELARMGLIEKGSAKDPFTTQKTRKGVVLSLRLIHIAAINVFLRAAGVPWYLWFSPKEFPKIPWVSSHTRAWVDWTARVSRIVWAWSLGVSAAGFLIKHRNELPGWIEQTPSVVRSLPAWGVTALSVAFPSDQQQQLSSGELVEEQVTSWVRAYEMIHQQPPSAAEVTEKRREIQEQERRGILRSQN